jgi:RHS repeat-associated protein
MGCSVFHRDRDWVVDAAKMGCPAELPPCHCISRQIRDQLEQGRVFNTIRFHNSDLLRRSNDHCARNSPNKLAVVKVVTGGDYTCDNDANTLSDASGKSYMWDFDNRMVSSVVPGTGTVTFKYDPFGRRIYKSSPSFTGIFAYDGFNLIQTMNSGGTVVSRYTLTQNIDEPLAEFRSGSNSYYDADGLGSITSLSSSAGALANTYTYDSFGNVTSLTGTLSNPFRYAGREFDGETGLYFNRARYYDSTAGRFLTEDPIRFFGGNNFYEYVSNHPTDLVDPWGLCPGTTDTTTPPTNPCAGFGASNLDYSASKQHIIDEHLAWFQLKSAPSTSSQYMFIDSVSTIDQAWAQIMAFNANSFTNPQTVSRVGNAYRFTASYPLHPPAAYTGFERRRFNTIFGIPFSSSWRTTSNTVVVNIDCKTVVTSYPGNP